MRSIPTPLLLGALLCGACSSAHAANTPLTEYLELERTDLAVAGVGGIGAAAAHGGGAGELVLEGVSGEVTLALLYWNGIDIEKPADGYSGGDGNYDEVAVVFDGSPVTGTRVAGGGNNNGWPGSVDSAALYRADVTDLVAGSGTYPISGFSDGAGHSTNGVSLIVYYDDGIAANDRRVAHIEGLESNLDLPGTAVAGFRHLFDVDHSGGTVEMVVHISDGQTVHSHGQLQFKAWPGLLPEDTTSMSFSSPHVDGHPLWSGKSVPQMGFPRPMSGPGLWDIQRFDITPLFDTPRRYNVFLSYFGGSDALSMHVLQLVQPADPLPWLDPPQHDFGDVAVDTIGGHQEFTFSNHSQQPLEMLSSTVHTAFPIVADGCSGSFLAAGESCTVTVACAPTAAFERVVSLHVDWRVGAGTTQRNSAWLRCAGVTGAAVAKVAIAPTQHWFGTQLNGTVGAPQRFTVTSVGQQPLTIDDVRVTTTTASLRFAVVADTCVDRPLQPGGTCTVDVVFKPLAGTDLAARRAVLRVAFDSDGVEYPATDAPIAGLGVPDFSAIFRDGFEN